MPNCEIDGCKNPGQEHHGLRDRPPFNDCRPGNKGGPQWRNEAKFKQYLCEEHHLRGMHQLFEDGGKWPVGFGFADRPLLRGRADVERLIKETAAKGKITKKLKKSVDRGRHAAGGFANKILYDMCSQFPLHDDIGVVEGKIGLIGQYYAAAPKRGIGLNADGESMNFLRLLAQDVVASNIDIYLEPLREIDHINRGSVDVIAEAHSNFQDVILDFINKKWNINTKNNKAINRTSFCSKYLHFHAPNAFFIYDSVVLKRFGLKNVVPYREFLDLMLKYAESSPDRHWTPRSIDMEVYGYKVSDKV